MALAFWICAVVTLLSVAASDVDINRLFHSDRQPQQAPAVPPPPQIPKLPTLPQPSGAASASKYNTQQSIDDPVQPENYDEFVPAKEPSHDAFDWALSKNVLLKKPTNTILSPFLVKLLLSMLSEAAGSGTQTERELATVWPTVQNNIKTREHYGKIFGSLQAKNPHYDLNLGVKVLVDNFIRPNQRYKAIIEAFYHAEIETLDFSQTRESVNRINSWTRNITNNFIKEIVTEADIERAVIVIVNAIYFNGYWRRPFPENATTSLLFKTDERNTVQSEFMDLTADFYYMEDRNLDAKVLRLPYKGGKFAMTLILPNRVGGLDEMIAKWDSSSLNRIQWLMDEVEVRVLLPKFAFDTEAHLKDHLTELGIESIFTLHASFPLLARGIKYQDRLQVSSVLQKTGINVNEKGSTVYAATQVSLTNKFGGDYEFRADHPFMFIIEDESTKTLLFAGKVTNPLVSS